MTGYDRQKKKKKYDRHITHTVYGGVKSTIDRVCVKLKYENQFPKKPNSSITIKMVTQAFEA